MSMAERRLHERTLELAASAIDFDLTGAEAVELDAHLSACLHCVRDAAAIRADAIAIRAPVGLLPSRRVDDAVYWEIAQRGARPQRLLLLAAAALLLVALLGGAAVGAFLLRGWQTLPTTVIPTPTAPVAVVDPRPETSPVVVGETWGTIAIPASDVGTGWIGRMEAVTVTDSGFVAVGRPVCVPQNDPTKCHASVWTAASGEGWTRAPDQPGLEVGRGSPSGPQPGLFDVATGPAGLVAIGYAFDDDLGGPRIWQSQDGRTWQRNAFAFGPSGEQARISAIAASSQGYVIVGWVIADTGREARAAAWISPDGVTWRRADDTERMDVGPCVDTGEEPMCGGMRSVVPSESGFVAVGYVRSIADPAEPSQPAAWTSSDGLTWTRSDAGLDFKGTLSGVTAGGRGLIAVGAVGTICQPDCGNASAGGIAATSVDGSTWSVERVTGAPALEDVVAAGSRSFALGALNSDADPRGDLQLWRSDDGVAWLRVLGLPSISDATSYRSLDVAAADDRVVVVGWAEVAGADVRRNFAYVSPPAGLSAPPTPSPLPSGPVASTIDPVVLLRVEIRGDRRDGWMTRLTVYRDGAVLHPDQDGGRLTRLTPAGLALLLAPATESEAFTNSGVIERDPGATNPEVASYAVDFRVADRLVRRWTTNAPRPADQDETARIMALARRIVDHESWLPAEAWLTAPASATRYVPSHFLLKVGVSDNPLNDLITAELDVADVDWPLDGRMVDFGQPAERPVAPDITWRCGALTFAEAEAVRDSVRATPFVPLGFHSQADLRWRSRGELVTLVLTPVLPDDPPGCPSDLFP